MKAPLTSLTINVFYDLHKTPTSGEKSRGHLVQTACKLDVIAKPTKLYLSVTYEIIKGPEVKQYCAI